MLDTIKELIRQNDLCVLATIGPQGPHTSLMAYASASDANHIFLVTPKDTLKYENMVRDPRVSLMIDSRDRAARQEIRALTVSGHAEEVADPETIKDLHDAFTVRHPHLKRLIEQPDVAWISVQVDSFQLLNGVHDAHHVRLGS